MNALLWRKRQLLWRSVIIDLKTQLAGTVLGMAWIIIGPLLLLAIYTVVYSYVFNVRIPSYSQNEYILNLFSGLVPFLAFSQSLSSAANSLTRDKRLLVGAFPAEMIPIKAVLSSYLTTIPSTVAVVTADALISTPSVSLLLVPVVLLLQLLFSVGLGLLISLATLAIRDIGLLIQYAVMALLVITPIAYTPEMVPARLKPLLAINPLYYFVTANQHLVLLNRLPDAEVILVMTVISCGTAVIGLLMFQRVKVVLMDLL